MFFLGFHVYAIFQCYKMNYVTLTHISNQLMSCPTNICELKDCQMAVKICKHILKR